MQESAITDEIIVNNQNEYPELFDKMRWLGPEQGRKAATIRQTLVDEIFRYPGPDWGYRETKLFTHSLSPGCALCGSGDWSCLFINGVCNAKCFYCPASQNDPGSAMTHTLAFEDPKDYADYVNRFGIKGVSFSGGEPLLTFERVIQFLDTLKSKADHEVYTWMYTNGLLATKEKMAALKGSGLDEIRFDLSADDYRLDALEKALGVIPRVTVEIPAIPEDLARTRKLIKTLHEMGVNHLNLHQIRCTPFNAEKLIQRGYTFVHGPKVTVLETEQTALELIRFSLENDIALPINYCSFTYRHQFQGAGARKRYAQEVKKAYEDVTPTGHIRHLKIMGDPHAIDAVAGSLDQAGADTGQWSMSGKKDTLSFSYDLLSLIDFSNVRLKVAYSAAAVRPVVSYRHPFKTIALNSACSVVVEKQTVKPAVMMGSKDIELLKSLLASGKMENQDGVSDAIEQILPFERVAKGLGRYC